MIPARDGERRKDETMSTGTKSYSKKQAGVIYRSIKSGKLHMSKDAISAMYDGVDYIDVYDERTLNMAKYGIKLIKNAVDSIFADDFEGAQMSINLFMEMAA